MSGLPEHLIETLRTEIEKKSVVVQLPRPRSEKSWLFMSISSQWWNTIKLQGHYLTSFWSDKKLSEIVVPSTSMALRDTKNITEKLFFIGLQWGFSSINILKYVPIDAELVN
jgi:hypothetical protein